MYKKKSMSICDYFTWNLQVGPLATYVCDATDISNIHKTNETSVSYVDDFNF